MALPSATLTDQCPLCQHARVNSVGVKTVDEHDYQLVRCAQCQFVFVTPVPSRQELARHYEIIYAREQDPARAEDASSDQGIEALRFERRLRKLAQFTRRGRLLDVGCKDGAFLALARAQGWAVHGVEFSKTAAAQARDRGLDVFTGTLEEAPLARERFDVITMWHVIEHVPDPLALLRLVATLLKPGGIVAMETPNVEGRGFRRDHLEWEYVSPPSHLRYFGPRSLAFAFRQTGYTLVGTQYEGGTGLGPQLSKVGLDHARRWALAHYRWILPLKQLYLRVFGWLAPSDDIVIVYARKNS